MKFGDLRGEKIEMICKNQQISNLQVPNKYSIL